MTQELWNNEYHHIDAGLEEKMTSSYPDDDARFEDLNKSVPQSNDHLKNRHKSLASFLMKSWQEQAHH